MGELRFDVFLSYNSVDRPAIERIATTLRRQHIEPWWDQWALTPGRQWQTEIVEGLRASRACAVFVGSTGLGDWAREELAVAQDVAAKDRGFRLFMVLLPGAPELFDASLAFLRTRTWVDLRRGIADRDGIQDLVSAVTGAPRRRDVGAADTDTCPYRGLEAFEEEHAELFFGRENDVAMVVEKLKASRFLAVLGPSGSGKSSLLRAGVLPALRRGALVESDTWALRVFTPGPRPVTALATQLAHLFVGKPVQETLDRLRADVRSLDLAVAVGLDGRLPGARVVLVVDQFEELFTLCSDEDERRSFLSNLLYAATIPGGRVVVVIGMRADFYPRCAPYPDLRMLVADQQFLVGPLDEAGLRQAIEEPARRVRLDLEAGLVETIMADVGDRVGTLPLLEHVLLEVWKRRRGTMLTLEAYVASGGLEGALAQRADAVYTGLPAGRQEIARRVLLRLVNPGESAEDTRRRAEMGELVTSVSEEGDVEAVVEALTDQRLLTIAQHESEARVVTITHEALIRGWPRLRAWINESREELRAQRHLTGAAAEWERRERQDDDLYGGARLAFWKGRDLSELTESERAFVVASRRQEARARAAGRRRVRVAVAGVGVGLAAVAVVALLGLRNVATERDAARSGQLAAEAVSLLQTDPAAGLVRALEAYDRKPTREAQRALRQAVITPGSRVQRLRGHEGFVTDAVFSPDGRRVASAGSDGTVRIWDRAGKDEPTVLRADGHLNSVAFSPDGARVVAGGRDGTVRTWDWTGMGGPSVLRGHGGEVTGAGFSPDGRRVVSAGRDGTVRLWDVAGNAELSVLRGHEGHVTSAGFSVDGRRVVSSGGDGTVRVWDPAGGAQVVVLRGHEGDVSSAAFSKDGKRVVSTGRDETVRVWILVGGVVPKVLRGHGGSVAGAEFSPDGRRVVSAGSDGTVRVWDWAGGSEPTVLRGHERFLTGAAFGPDGRQVVSASGDGTLRVWDLAAGGGATVLRGHEVDATGAGLSPDGTRVVSAGGDGTVRVWQLAEGDEPLVLRGHQAFVADASFSPDGRQVVSAGGDGTVRVWTWAGGNEPIVLRGHEHDVVFTARFGGDGRRVVSAGIDGTVRVWNAAGGGQPIILRGHVGGVHSATFRADGDVVSAGADGTVRVWDLDGGAPPLVLSGHQGEVSSASFSADGTRVVSAGADGTVRVWDPGGDAPPIVLRGHEGKATDAAFGAEGKVVSGGSDGTVRVWDWVSGTEPTVFRGHQGNVYSAIFGTDGRRVVSAGVDGTVRVWDCSTCASVEQLVALARTQPSS